MIMIAVGLLLSLVLCLLFGVPYIDFLRKKMIGQYILELAPENHAQKAGTPTTGGVFIVLAIVISSVNGRKNGYNGACYSHNAFLYGACRISG